MRVWRQVELDRVGPGRWQLRWHRISTTTGMDEHVRIEGPLWRVLGWAPMVARRRWR